MKYKLPNEHLQYGFKYMKPFMKKDAGLKNQDFFFVKKHARRESNGELQNVLNSCNKNML